jgi:hypothetical protein
MITNRLFGQIRKFNLGYIVGEVLLIFIGITLSFYFDEWRTNRLDRTKEREILSEIFSSVKRDTARLQILFNLNDIASKKMSFLLDSTRHENVLSDKSQECFGYLNFYHSFSPDWSAYNNLKNEGLDLITNTKLRVNMIRYYEQMEDQSDWTNNISEVHFRQYLLPYIIDEFSIYLRGDKAIPFELY